MPRMVQCVKLGREAEGLEKQPIKGELGLRVDSANIVDFGPAALSRVTQAHRKETSVRRRLERVAQANFAAQAQTHEAVIELLTPIRTRYQELRAESGELERLLAEGAARARETSEPTLVAMYERMGFARPGARQADPGLASGTRRL